MNFSKFPRSILFELLGVKTIDVVEGGSDMMAEMEKKASGLKDSR